MRWQDFPIWEKGAIVVLGLWLTAGWLVAGFFPNPRLFIELPYMLIFGTMAALGLTGWLLRRLGH